MSKFDPEIVSLRRDIENEVKRKIKTPYDFEFLAGVVWERLHEYISPTTLKRLWGYIAGANTTRNSTLCLLSRFLGFEDWDAYLNYLKAVEDEESDAFRGCGVRSDELIAGQTVEITWFPNRRCVFKYLGHNTYVVNQSHNAKLQVGDTFQAMCFLEGHPMYLDNLLHDGNAPISYVAGSKKGILKVVVNKNKTE